MIALEYAAPVKPMITGQSEKRAVEQTLASGPAAGWGIVADNLTMHCRSMGRG